MITDMTSTTLKAMAMEDSMPKLTLIKYFKPFSVGVGVDLECMGRPFTLEDPGVPGVAEEAECPGVVNFSSLDRLKNLVKRILLTNHVHYLIDLPGLKIECLCTNKPRFNSISAYVTHPEF